MAGMIELGRRVMSSRLTLALAGLTFVVPIALMKSAEILRAATGNDGDGGVPDLGKMAQELADRALPLTIAVAPLVFVAGALALQFGGPSGARRAAPIMYGSIGAVAAVIMAKGLAA